MPAQSIDGDGDNDNNNDGTDEWVVVDVPSGTSPERRHPSTCSDASTASVEDEDEESSIFSPPPANTSPAPTPKSRFPTSLSDLYTAPPEFNPNSSSIYTHLRALHHSTLSPLPRLRSILTDSLFVRRLAQHTSLPLIANERCGSWYIPPDLKAGSAYFKSTDGHVGQWGFSLRRLNLELLKVLGERGGAVLVDSTRRGKSYSDALRRTVPIWVAVVNAELFGMGHRGVGRLATDGFGGRAGPGEKCLLQSPEGGEGLTASERAEVERKIALWRKDFMSLGLEMQRLRNWLKRPIRCVWAVNGEWDFETKFEDRGLWAKEYENVLVLASASRRVRGAEMSEGGYIQGAADDSEGWSRGLTADLWWENNERLLAAGDGEIVGMIDDFVAEHKSNPKERKGEEVQIEAAPELFVGAGVRETDGGDWDLIISCHDRGKHDCSNVVSLGCREGKLGSLDLREKLRSVVDTAGALRLPRPGSRILIICSTGRDLSVGVALVLLCLFYSNDGKIVNTVSTTCAFEVNKLLIKKRLAWITESKSDANPSRATMNAVNNHLIGRPK